MKRKQFTAILMSAIMAVSTCMPMNGIQAMAAENADAAGTAAVAVAEAEQPGVKELLSELRRNGILISIATGSFRHIVRSNMEMIGITEYVDAIATSEDCARGKPEPDVFLAAAKFLGVDPSECLVVEDSRNGLIGAKRAGMCCAGFGGSQIPARIELAPVSFNDYRMVRTADLRQWYEEQQ